MKKKQYRYTHFVYHFFISMNNHMHDHEYVIHCLLPLLPTLFLRSFLRPLWRLWRLTFHQRLPAACNTRHLWTPTPGVDRAPVLPRGGKCFIVWKGDKQYDSTEYQKQLPPPSMSTTHIPPLSLPQSHPKQPDSRPSLFHPGAPAPDLQLWPSVTGVLSPGWPAS